MSSAFARSLVWPRAIVRIRTVQRLSAVCLLTTCLGLSDSPEEPGPSLESDQSRDFCQRPEPGSVVPETQELRSHHGLLQVDLTIRNQRQPDGSTRYCYLTPDGKLSPTLRLKPGELLILRFQNKLTDLGSAALILLRHKLRRLFGGNLRAQQGHRGRMRASAVISI